jgi:hypothetical protein
MSEVTVEVKNLKREMYKVGEALQFSAQPIVEAARAAAPSLRGTKRGRIPGLLRQRMGSVIQVSQSGVTRLRIGPLSLSRKEKGGPFYGRFQEKGWQATGRANRRTAKRRRLVPGLHFLRNAALAQTAQAFTVFKARLIQKFEQDQASGAI